MKKEDWKTLLSIIATLLSSVIVIVLPNKLMRVIFIILYIIEIVLIFNYLEKKTRKKRITLVVILFILICILVIPLFVNHLSYVDSFKQFINAMDMKQSEDIDEKISNINVKINELSDELIKYKNWSSKKDQNEIDTIKQQIQKRVSEYKDSFTELKTSKNEVELFYKMCISPHLYYYYNIIKAFEAYGIDCELMNIDEHTLVLWDIEVLFSYYNMQKEVQGDLNKGVSYKNQKYEFNKYKIIDETKYIDDFDYQGWVRKIGDAAAEQTRDELHKDIMGYHELFKHNFSDNSD